MISGLRTQGLYQNNNNEEVQLSFEHAVKTIIEEIHSIESTPKIPGYKKIDQLNLDLLWKKQWQDMFCKKKEKEMKMKPDPNFIIDEDSILKKSS